MPNKAEGVELRELVESLEHDYTRPLWHEQHAQECRRCKILASLNFFARKIAEERLGEARLALMNVQGAIAIWLSWDSDDGCQAANTAMVIRDRIQARIADLEKKVQHGE